MAEAGGESLTVSRVAFRSPPPPVWRANPGLWFAQIESQFVTAGITTDDTKFHHIVAAIESEVLSQVSDIVLNPPAADKYQTLKKRLIEQFADSEEKRLKMLLQGLELGDQRPTQLLRQMRDLAAGRIGDDVLKSLWLQRLPTSVQQILAVSGENLAQLAVMADKITEVGDISSLHVAATQIPTDHLVRLEREIAELTAVVNKLSANAARNVPRFRPRSNSKKRFTRSSSPHPSQEPGASDNLHTSPSLCWYHTHFGAKANKCKPPCSFVSEN